MRALQGSGGASVCLQIAAGGVQCQQVAVHEGQGGGTEAPPEGDGGVSLARIAEERTSGCEFHVL